MEILAAAREAFAEGGFDVGTDEIARRAGVGKGTLYRRFPTKKALLDAVLEDVVERYEALAAVAETVPDPLDGLRTFLVGAAQMHLDDAAFFEAAVKHDMVCPDLRDRTLAACASTVGRAVSAGAVRSDLEAMDVARMVKMLAVAGPPLERYATLLLEGARPR